MGSGNPIYRVWDLIDDGEAIGDQNAKIDAHLDYERLSFAFEAIDQNFARGSWINHFLKSIAGFKESL